MEYLVFGMIGLIATSVRQRAERHTRSADKWLKRRGGWPRIWRNAAVGYVQQSGG